ncbi:MAG: c-type cytochrome [Betaproteobacteria bacterium]
MRVPALLAAGAAVLLAVLPPAASAQDAASFFEDNCAMCHTIGGDPQGGPDLKGVTQQFDREWLIRFMLDPDAMSKTDRTAAALVAKWDGAVMPAIDGLTRDRAEALLRYIVARSGGAPAGQAAPAAQPAPPAAAPSRADIAVGHDLYIGRRRLAASGPACLTCHRLGSLGALGGGTLGPDLSAAARRLGGSRGLTAWLSRPPTRVMRAVFSPAPLAADETRALAALLDDTAAQPAAARASVLPFVSLGAAGAVGGLVLLGAAWRGRFRGVRRPLIDRARARAGELR